MQNINKKDKSKKFLSKKTVLLSSMITSLATVPLGVTANLVLQNNKHEQLVFEDQTFNSRTQLANYIKSNSVQTKYNEESNKSTWSVIINNKKYTYNNPAELQNALYEKFGVKLTSETFYTSRSDAELDYYIDKSTGFINNEDYLKVVNKNVNLNNKENVTDIYETYDGKILYDLESSYKSYYNDSINAYQFNGLYFESKADLKTYLKESYLPSNKQSQLIVLQAPNGAKSAPINLSEQSAYNSIKSFIQNNSSNVVEYIGSKGQKIHLTKENVNKHLVDISANDLSYIHVQSNEGKSRYVIDNSVHDNHNLIGPYLYQGNLDVGAFMNKNMWRKSTGIDNVVWQESKIDTMIGQFFTSIINDDNNLNIQEAKQNNESITIFRTLIAGKDKNVGLDAEYMNTLKKAEPEVYNEVLKTLENLMNGKKFNTFYKIPIMYSFILHRLIQNNSTNFIIEKTIEYFTKVANYIQNAIEVIVLDQSLLLNSRNQKFDVKTFFGIGNPEFDINVNVEYFMNQIKQWPQLVAAMSVYTEALNNVNMMAGSIGFAALDHQYLFDFKAITEEQFYQKIDSYEKIYETHSSIDFNKGFLPKFVKYSNYPGVAEISKLPNTQWEAELNKIIMSDNIPLNAYIQTVFYKNILDYTVSKNALETEIVKYLETKEMLKDGLLAQLGPAADTFAKAFDPKNQNTNTDVDVYLAYLCIVADMRGGATTFTNPSTMVNKVVIAQNLFNFSAMSLATAGLVANAFNNLYWKHLRWFTWNGSVVNAPGGVFNSIKRVVSTVYNNVTEAFLRLKNWTSRVSYILENAFSRFDVYSPSKSSSYKFFTKLDKFVNFLNVAAPVLGSSFFLINVIFLAINIFTVQKSPLYYVYTTIDGKEFIWDGGEIECKYLGFETNETVTIDSMKLVKPVEFNLPQLEEFYYYNGNKYYDINEMMQDQLNYIVSDSYNNQNPRFTKKYSFSKDNLSLANTLDELISIVLNDLNIVVKQDNTLDFSKLNSNSKYLSSLAYQFNGTTSNVDGNRELIAENIVNNIRPTKFAKLPEIVDGYAIPSLSIKETVIPGLVWKSSKIIDNTAQANKYLIDNSANEIVKQITDWTKVDSSYFAIPDANQAVLKSSEKLYNLFKSKFNIKRKTVLSKDITNKIVNENNSFNSLKSDVRGINIYTLQIPGKDPVKFFDEGLAQTYLLTQLGIQKNIKYVSTYSYNFNGIIFKNEKEIYSWIDTIY